MPSETDTDYSLVRSSTYFQSLRSSGYKSTSKAVAELIDNSVQAEASVVQICFETHKPEGRRKEAISRVLIWDDGKGMNQWELREGLRIGGSARFGDRSGLGRFGMGLKNASFSQCKRLEVYSWSGESPGFYSYLDLKEIEDEIQQVVPRPENIDNHRKFGSLTRPDKSGTLVVWDRCDRLDRNGVATTLAQDLRNDLGQIFRKQISSNKLSILVDGTEVDSFDPLFLDVAAEFSGAVLLKEAILDVSGCIPGLSGEAIIRVSVFPEQWQKDPASLPGEHQDRIQWRHDQSPGFSILRNGREIDRGMFSIRRRHWSDKWWAAELSFSAELDELFGVTNTKQQVTLQTDLRDRIKHIAKSTISLAANIVTDRAATQKSDHHVEQTERIAKKLEANIGTPEWIQSKSEDVVEKEIEAFCDANQKVPNIKSDLQAAHDDDVPAKVFFDSWEGGAFVRAKVVGKVIVVVLNQSHAFFQRLYQPLCQAEKTNGVGFELLLVALIKAYSLQKSEGDDLDELLLEWGNVLGTYLTESFLAP